MTYIPRLSPTQWAWTQNPTECLARLKERAANLFADGYDVTHLPAIGTFLVKQEGKQGYTVDIVNQTCTCPFFTKAEIPQCPTCKHLLGLAALVEETILLLAGLAKQHEIARRKRQAGQRWQQWCELVGAWNRAMEQAEANACEMDIESYRRWKITSETEQAELEMGYAA